MKTVLIYITKGRPVLKLKLIQLNLLMVLFFIFLFFVLCLITFKVLKGLLHGLIRKRFYKIYGTTFNIWTKRTIEDNILAMLGREQKSFHPFCDYVSILFKKKKSFNPSNLLLVVIKICLDKLRN